MSDPLGEAAGGWRLESHDGRIELRSTQPSGAAEPGAVCVDFVGGKMGYSRRVPGSRLLFRAIGTGTGGSGGLPSVIDATAGLGRDAFLLACKGYRVMAIERSPIVAALLEDGMRRAMENPAVRETLDDRLRFVTGDARVILRELPPAERPDVVYVDPMFPARAKAAMVKKESVALRAVVGADQDAAELLDAARVAARRRVVVKRMRHAPPIAPGVVRTYEGKSVRFDVYSPAPDPGPRTPGLPD